MGNVKKMYFGVFVIQFSVSWVIIITLYSWNFHDSLPKSGEIPTHISIYKQLLKPF